MAIPENAHPTIKRLTASPLSGFRCPWGQGAINDRPVGPSRPRTVRTFGQAELHGTGKGQRITIRKQRYRRANDAMAQHI